MKASQLCAAAVVCAAAGATARASVAPREGSLAVRDGKAVVLVPLRHTDVHVRVTGLVAEVAVEQTFANPWQKKIDATYLFPLPTGAAVHDMAIVTSGRTIAGTIGRRDEAARRYRLARQAGHVAALLTEERPNLFTQAVASIEPGAEIKVTLRYAEALPWSDGGYELVFPTVAGPRHVPASSKLTPEAAAALRAPVLPEGQRPSTDVAIDVALDAGVAIDAPGSPSHRIVVERPSAQRAHVTLAPGDTVPDRDFVLRWRVAGAGPSLAFAAHKDGALGSFVLVAQPPAGVTAERAAPKEVLFVIDTSSSMAGPPLARAKAAVRGILAGLGPDDTFQILHFDDGQSALGPRGLAVKPRNLRYALDWLEALDAGGGTDMTAGIDAALAYPRDPGRLHIIAFFTDGFVGNEDEALARIDGRIGDARLYAFGVGSAVNRYLLEEMAALGRGAAVVLRPDEDAAEAARRFEARLARPVLTDVAIDWGGLGVSDVTPARLPDLFAGQPLVVTGRYRQGAAGQVVVTGKLGGAAVSFPVAVTLPERDAARPEVAWLWARARIAELQRRVLRGETPALRDEITELALAHRLVTPYTAFVAVDTSRVTKGQAGETVPVAVNVPEGVERAVLRGTESGVGVGGGGAGMVSYGTIGHGSGAAQGAGIVSGHSAQQARLVVSAPGEDGRAPALAQAPPALERDAAPALRLDAAPALALDAAARDDVKKCWIAAGRKGRARLVVRVVTGADGHPTSVTLDDTGADVSACVAARARAWSLAPARTAAIVVAVGVEDVEASDSSEASEETTP